MLLRTLACVTLFASTTLHAQAPAQFSNEQPRYGGTAVAALGADPAALNPNITVGVPDVFAGCILYDGEAGGTLKADQAKAVIDVLQTFDGLLRRSAMRGRQACQC